MGRDRDYEERVRLEAEFVREISQMPIVVHQQEANDQHYEISAEFYQICFVIPPAISRWTN